MSIIEASAVDVHVFCREAGQPLYLLLRRAPGKRYAGCWRVVTGKIEAGELPAHAAVRELHEETGLRPTGLWVLDYLHNYYDPVENLLRCIPVFVVEVAARKVTLSEEHDDLRWVTNAQAAELLRWPGQREGLRRAHDDVAGAVDRGALFRVPPHA